MRRSPLKDFLQFCKHGLMRVAKAMVVVGGGRGGGSGQTNVVCLGDLNHFQVHPDSDFTCGPYFRSLPQSQTRAQSLSEGA